MIGMSKKSWVSDEEKTIMSWLYHNTRSSANLIAKIMLVTPRTVNRYKNHINWEREFIESHSGD